MKEEVPHLRVVDKMSPGISEIAAIVGRIRDRMIGDPMEQIGYVPPHIEQLVEDRADTHGDYGDFAATWQKLRRAVECGAKWHEMTDVQRATVEMILFKVSRLVNGNPALRDHYDDIAGYAIVARDKQAVPK